MRRILTRSQRVFDTAIRTDIATSPWSRTVGAARSAIALMQFLTMLLTPTGHLFDSFTSYPTHQPVIPREAVCSGVRSLSAWCVADATQIGFVRLLALVVLALVVVGVVPRWTVVAHWYVSWSLLGAALVEGGDQIAAVVTLLLVPWGLADPRRTHWACSSPRGAVSTIIAGASLKLLRLQTAVVYGHAAIAKVARPEWADGTAMWYWLNDPIFGAHGGAGDVLLAVAHHPAGVALLTYGTIAVEAALAVGVLTTSRRRARVLFGFGAALHLSIGAIIGLTGFSGVMVALLAICFLHEHPRLAGARPAGAPEIVLASDPPVRLTGAAAQA